ncbi:hypothetical protein [Pelagicoccus sp. SDUM812002]|uniref:hypothetical protein n=1 Tax=Pelagicoccus sp. SDUM812002 TaxID=3041266 RepID=UPI00280D4C4A|nr:hypothetical protein [Pelagicoccus sp. SDUM812002]MDQ8188186.1 hypothetical protein [Pelagicoccus sp. SDUM812002]
MKRKENTFDYYELSQELNRKGWRNFSILILATLTATGWVSWKVFLWQNHRKLEAAQIAWAEQKVEESRTFLREVNRQAAKRTRYDDQQLKILSLTSPEAALAYIQSVREEGTVEPLYQDRLARIGLDAAIASGDPTQIEQQLQIVENSGLVSEDDPDLNCARAWLALAESDTENLLKYIQTTLRQHPLHTGALMLRSQIQATSTDPMERIQALSTLRILGQAKEAYAVPANALLIGSELCPIGSEDFAAAKQRLQQSPYFDFHYRLKDPALLRSLIVRLGELDSALSLRLSEKLLLLPEANDMDRLKHCYFAQKTGATEDARDLLDSISPDGAQSDQFAWIRARQLAAEGRSKEAMAAGIEGLNTVVKREFAGFLQDFTPSLDSKSKAQVQEQILQTPDLPLAAYLTAVETLWDEQLQPKQDIINYCLEKASTDPLAIAGFFSRKGHPELVIQSLASKSEATASQMGFSLYFDALLRTQQWTEARDLINAANTLGPYDLAVAQLLLALSQDETEEIETTWQLAQERASLKDSPYPDLVKLADIAYRYERNEWAGQLYRDLYRKRQLEAFRLNSLLSFYQIERKAGNTQVCLDLLHAALALAPNVNELKREAAYLGLLLGQDTLTAKDSLRKLVTQRDEDPATRYYLALALVKTGRSKQALELVGPNQPDTATDNASIQVIRYVVLNHNERYEESANLAETIDQTQLLPEEVVLLSQHRPVRIEHIVIPDTEEGAPRLSNPTRVTMKEEGT